MSEEWRDVPGYENLYKVSNTGKVFSKRSNRCIVLGRNNGYDVVSTRVGGRKGKALCLKVHILVALSFLDKPSDELISTCASQGYGKPIVRHKDNNKLNNAPDNLCWGTHQQNTDDYTSTDHFKEVVKALPRGFDHSFSVLSKEQLEDIRTSCVLFSRTQGTRAFARKYGVSHNTVRNVFNGISYVDH